MRLWIVEDEIAASKRIASLIHEVIENVEIEEIIDNVNDLRIALKSKLHPDLIFSDIQLADGISIPQYMQFRPSCPIVFTTAYDHYAVEVFKLNSIHYLLKPIDKKGLAEAYEKYKKAGVHFNADLHNLLKLVQSTPRTHKDQFLFKSGTRLYPVAAVNIALFYSKDKLVEAFIDDGKKLAASHTLEELEKDLDPALFFRANRQTLVNRHFIDKIHLSFNGKLKLEMQFKTPEEITISREKAGVFRQWMGE